MKKIRMRKYVLVHLNGGVRCMAPSRGAGVKVTSQRPKKTYRVRCEIGNAVTWRRAERVVGE